MNPLGVAHVVRVRVEQVGALTHLRLSANSVNPFKLEGTGYGKVRSTQYQEDASPSLAATEEVP